MSESTALLFGRLRAPVDPNAPPKARPALDAVKALLAAFVAQAGTSLGPMLLTLFQKYLAQLTTTAGTEDAPAIADLRQLVAELSEEHGVSASSTLPDFEFIRTIFKDAIAYFGPLFIQWAISELEAWANPPAESTEVHASSKKAHGHGHDKK